MATAAEPQTTKAPKKAAPKKGAATPATTGGNIVGQIAQVIGAVVDVSFDG